MRIRTWHVAVGLAVVALVGWMLTVRVGRASPLLVAAPEDVAERLGVVLRDGELYAAIGTTLWRAALALTIATLAGVAVGMALGRVRFLGDAYYPLLKNSFAIPFVIFYPVFVVFFGIGALSKVALAVVYCFYPVAIQTAAAASSVPANLPLAAVSMGATPRQVMTKVVFRATVPGIVSGLRVAIALALLVVVAGEYIAGTSGVGYLLADTSQRLDSVGTYTYAIVVVALAVLANAVIGLLDRFQATT